MFSRTCAFLIAALGVLPGLAAGDRTISADAYLDKLRGMWVGELAGNYAGRPFEGSVQKWGLTATLDWGSIIVSDPNKSWDGDDDTCFEYLYGDLLMSNPAPTDAAIAQQWLTHVSASNVYMANRQARWLMDYGLTPPDTGSIRQNIRWFAIDSQITTEAVGAVSPGMRQQAVDLAAKLAKATNQGYPVHAAQFYATMYAAAAFDPNVESIVEKGLAVVPTTSRTYQVVQDVRNWYAADPNPSDPNAWRATQALIYDKYGSAGGSNNRYLGWIESTVNVGMTTMSLLYGQGDYKKTVEIAVLGGFDSDCNPATAGGLIGLIRGASGLPADLQAASDKYTVSGTLIDPNGLPLNTTVSQVSLNWQAAAEAQIPLAGGWIDGNGPVKVYHLPDSDPVSPPPEKYDPTGPKGLVGQVKALGGVVTVSASVERHVGSDDRQNLDQIIDGITDVSYNGRVAYTTDDGNNPQPPGGDFYQLNFDRRVTFNKVIFYEGDLIARGNNNPRDANTPPWGGYFADLNVEVRDGNSAFIPVTNLHLSEPLDPWVYFQQIEMTFEPVMGDAIRIRGTAGGLYQYTSILEVEAYGVVPEPVTAAMLLFGGLAVVRRRCRAGRGRTTN